MHVRHLIEELEKIMQEGGSDVPVYDSIGNPVTGVQFRERRWSVGNRQFVGGTEIYLLTGTKPRKRS